jgi:glycosyltransferase involved in cell wall biosynthesis
VVDALPTFALVTPVRDEAENLRRLAGAVLAQSAQPVAWVVVENGSSDGTLAVARELAEAIPFLRVRTIPPAENARGGPVARAFQAGVAELAPPPEIVVKLDADVSFEADFLERLVRAFVADPTLGIASGTCCELDRDGVWREQVGAGWSAARGATRAYRFACLRDVLPLAEGMGWDSLDAVKASLHGWQTRTLGVPFRHHRRVGERDGSQWNAWVARGRASHYMGYRPTYLLLRCLYNALEEPAALGLLAGYLRARMARQPRYPEPAVLAVLRREQRLRALPKRLLELLLARRAPARARGTSGAARAL